MSTLKKADVLRMATVCLAAYPNIKLDEDGIDGIVGAWLPLLQDLDVSVAQLALRHVLTQRTIPTMPTPAEIRIAAARVMLGPLPSALEAWNTVVTELHYSVDGAVGRIRKRNPIAAEVARMVGPQSIWNAAVCVGGDDAPMRREFFRLYEKAVEREVEAHAMLPQMRQLTGTTPLMPPKQLMLKGSGV